MKKLFLLAAFAGLLGSTAVANTTCDDKDKKGKKECKKGEGKTCSAEQKEACAKDKKSCCKKKGEASAEVKAEEKK
ncbi:MAG: hypothetical protein HYX39_09695 [Bacteroidetes bacterium]|nr:hypothetical protein [Bacteroidota bacterium]